MMQMPCTTTTQTRFRRSTAAKTRSRLPPHAHIGAGISVGDGKDIQIIDGLLFRCNGSGAMRMDESAALTAREVVNGWSYEELRRILYDYGEERYAPRIAGAILRARETAPVETTLELVGIIKGAMW